MRRVFNESLHIQRLVFVETAEFGVAQLLSYEKEKSKVGVLRHRIRDGGVGYDSHRRGWIRARTVTPMAPVQNGDFYCIRLMTSVSFYTVQWHFMLSANTCLYKVVRSLLLRVEATQGTSARLAPPL